MEEMGSAYKMLVTELKGSDHVEDPGTNGNIISRQILWKCDMYWVPGRDQWQSFVNVVMDF
jgi:hypothetical protein